MNFKIRSVLTLLAATLFGTIHSTAALAANGSNSGRIYSLTWYEGHTGLLVRQDGMSDLGGCGRSDYFILNKDHESYKEIYALLLAVHMSDQSVSIDVDGCFQGISRIRHVTSTR
jgi:hypothetical protein